jgi:hypothetical protein
MVRFVLFSQQVFDAFSDALARTRGQRQP